MKISPGSKLLMIGDSITDCGRNRAAKFSPSDPESALGSGYVNFVNLIITSSRPQDKISIINRGIGGDTVRDLKARWEADAMDIGADWLSVMIGINDIWRNFGETPDEHVPIDEYTETLDELLRQIHPTLKGLILMTPYHFQPDRSDLMRSMMDEYGRVVKKLAEKYDAIFVDTQRAIDTLMEHTAPLEIAEDRIHCNAIGHMAMAMMFLKAIEFKID